LELNHAVRLPGVKAENEPNLRFKITGQNELFQILAIQVSIAVGDGRLTRISVGLGCIHGNLQKRSSGDCDIVSRRTLPNRRMNI
jgi:hypothetical protein